MISDLPDLVIACVLVWVVTSDLLYRRIANRMVFGLLLLWLAYLGFSLLPSGAVIAMPAHSVRVSILTGLAVLSVGYGLYAMRWMGAGDVKLMAVLSLWLGEEAPSFVIVSTVLGGALALTMPLLLQIERALALCLMQLDSRLPRPTIPLPVSLGAEPSHGIPYGIAIVCGAAVVRWSAL